MNAKRMAMAGLAAVLLAAGGAMADGFGTDANQFTIDFVTISGSTNPTSGIPAGTGFTFTGVHNDYRMGVLEITNDQWDKFEAELFPVTVTGSPANAYDEAPTWTGTNVPTNEVSWYEAAQFVNWLNTSTGHLPAYSFTGTQGQGDYALDTWSPAEAAGGTNLYRHKDAFYYLPTENEWVKAGYWNGTSLQTYATKDNTPPGEWTPTGGPNSDGQSAGWNYGYAYPDNSSATDQPWDGTAGYSPEELNGTFDMMGNVFEWMESPYEETSYGTADFRGLRGGSYSYYALDNALASSLRLNYYPYYEVYSFGFRVASEVPEPASLVLLSLGGLALIKRRRR